MEICGITCALTLHLHTLVNSCREREIAVNKKITQNVFSKTDSKVRTNCMIEKLIFIKGQNCWTNETPSYKKKERRERKEKNILEVPPFAQVLQEVLRHKISMQCMQLCVFYMHRCLSPFPNIHTFHFITLSVLK